MDLMSREELSYLKTFRFTDDQWKAFFASRERFVSLVVRLADFVFADSWVEGSPTLGELFGSLIDRLKKDK